MQSHQPVLELYQLIIDLLDVDIDPEDVIVAVDAVDDVVVEAVELLEQVELLADLQELGVLGDGEPEELLPTGVGDVLAVEVVKVVLVDEEAVASLLGRQAGHHRTALWVKERWCTEDKEL